MFNNHLMKVCLAAVFAIGLAACSSSDNGTDTSTPTPTEPAPPTQAEEDLEELQEQIAALRTQLGIDDTADIGTTVAELQATLKELQDAAAKMVTDAAVKAAEDLFAGIDGNRGGADDTNVDLEVTPTVMQTYGEAAEVTATVSVNGTALDPAPEVEATDTEVATQGVWKGTELTGGRMTPSTVVVYTDVEANESMPFDDVYADATDADGDLTMGANATTSAASYVPLISAPAFMHAGQKDHAPDATGTDNVVVRLPGTFHGASGQYTCTAAAANECVSHEDDNGVRLTVGGSAVWEFVPGPNAMVSVADGTYLYFGWWLYEDSDGPEVDAFHGATGSPEAIVEADFTALSGTATYSGAAAGQYAIDPVAPGTYASGGRWTADASLTADFGSETTNGMISGTIDNFMTDNGAEDWSVSLGETALLATGAFDSATVDPDVAGDDVVWTIDDEAAPESGAWSGGLRDQGDNNVPNGVTGEFSTTYSEDGHTIGHMVGAFGAHVDD